MLISFYYHLSEDDNYYIAEIPALAGCMADGSTEEEATDNIKTVAGEWLEVNKELDRPVPISDMENQ